MTRRGKFIVFEGCDRAGKSTQVKLLQEFITLKSLKAEIFKYPERQNASTGPLIQNYLTNVTALNDQTIHLLFSANRWELQNSLLEKLNSGITVIADRYVYSGIAYSHSKGLDLDWCICPDKGLLRPDLVFYLNLDPKEASKRSEYGLEKYENLEFQLKVAECFTKVFDELNTRPEIIQVGSRSIQEISKEISDIYSLKKENTSIKPFYFFLF